MFKFLAAKETDSVKPTTIRYIISPSSSKLPNTSQGSIILYPSPPLSPPALLYLSVCIRVIFFAPMKFILWRRCAPQGKNFQPFSSFNPLFFCNFVLLKSVRKKICFLYTNWGKNMYFSSFFAPFL